MAIPPTEIIRGEPLLGLDRNRDKFTSQAGRRTPFPFFNPPFLLWHNGPQPLQPPPPLHLPPSPQNTFSAKQFVSLPRVARALTVTHTHTHTRSPLVLTSPAPPLPYYPPLPCGGVSLSVLLSVFPSILLKISTGGILPL